MPLFSSPGRRLCDSLSLCLHLALIPPALGSSPPDSKKHSLSSRIPIHLAFCEIQTCALPPLRCEHLCMLGECVHVSVHVCSVCFNKSTKLSRLERRYRALSHLAASVLRAESASVKSPWAGGAGGRGCCAVLVVTSLSFAAWICCPLPVRLSPGGK